MRKLRPRGFVCDDDYGVNCREGGCGNPRPSARPYRIEGRAHPNVFWRIRVTDWSNRGRELLLVTDILRRKLLMSN